MNAQTQPAAQAMAAASTALTLPQRAAVALGESANAAKLRELAKQSSGILTVTNHDGRAEAHRAGMVLRSTRTSITAAGKTAREDATAFSKAVIALEKDLISIIEPEEARILALRDAFDAQVEAEKAAKIKAERERSDAIKARIEEVRALPLLTVGRTGAEISQMIYELAGTISADDAHAATFEEYAEEYKAVRGDVLDRLAAAESKQLGIEADARAAEQERAREAARMAAERAELEAQAAALVESQRLAKIESDRVAAEQAAQAKALAEQAAAVAAEAEKQRAAAAAEQAKVAAETKRQLDAQQAEIAAARKALQDEQDAAAARAKAAQEAADLAARRDADHAEALAIDAQWTQDRAAALLAEIAPQEAEVERQQQVVPTLEEMADEITVDEGPSDFEILDVVASTFGWNHADAIERLICVDFVALRSTVAPA